jgi:hypothetical protein
VNVEEVNVEEVNVEEVNVEEVNFASSSEEATGAVKQVTFEEELEEGEIREDISVDALREQMVVAQAAAKSAQAVFTRACEEVARLEGLLKEMEA